MTSREKEPTVAQTFNRVADRESGETGSTGHDDDMHETSLHTGEPARAGIISLRCGTLPSLKKGNIIFSFSIL